MEVLVMLAITAVVSTLVLQTIRSATANGLRIERHSRATIHDRLDINALRRTLAGTLIEYADPGEGFRGTTTEASGLTARPMAPGTSPVTAFRLAVETDTGRARLVYEEGGERYDILTASGAGLTLDYWDGIQESWVPQWPSPDGGVSTQGGDYYAALPQLLRVTAAGAGDVSYQLVFSLPQTAPPQPRTSDIFGTTP